MKPVLRGMVCLLFVSATVGCGSGLSEGQPDSTTPGVPLDSIQTGMRPVKGPMPKGSPTGEPEAAKKK